MTSKRRKKKITKMRNNRPHRKKNTIPRKSSTNQGAVNPGKVTGTTSSESEEAVADTNSDETTKTSTGWTPRGNEDLYKDHPNLAPDDDESLAPKYKKKQAKDEEEFEKRNSTYTRKKKRSPFLRFLGGAFGGIVLIGGIITAGYAIINYESDSQQEEAKKEAQAEQQANTKDQCYTLNSDLPVVTGNPTWDEALRISISKMDEKEHSAFNKSLFESGDPAKANPYWKSALKKAQGEDDLSIEPLTQIGPDTKVIESEKDKTTYSEGVMQLQEGMPAGVYRMQYQVSADKPTTHDVVLLVTGNSKHNTLVFPAENDDNESAVAVNTIQPICGGSN